MGHESIREIHLLHTACSSMKILPGTIKQTNPAWCQLKGTLFYRGVSYRFHPPGGCRGALWIGERAPSTSPHHPQCLTPSRSLYHVQLWSWVTGPLCDTSDPKPIYCLKSLPLSTTPTSTSLSVATPPNSCLSPPDLPHHKWGSGPTWLPVPSLQPALSAYRTDSSSWNETVELPSPPPIPPTRAPAYIYVFIKSTWRK